MKSTSPRQLSGNPGRPLPFSSTPTISHSLQKVNLSFTDLIPYVGSDRLTSRLVTLSEKSKLSNLSVTTGRPSTRKWPQSTRRSRRNWRPSKPRLATFDGALASGAREELGRGYHIIASYSGDGGEPKPSWESQREQVIPSDASRLSTLEGRMRAHLLSNQCPFAITFSLSPDSTR